MLFEERGRRDIEHACDIALYMQQPQTLGQRGADRSSVPFVWCFFVAVFGVCPMAAFGEDEQRSLDISTEYTASALTIEGPGGPVELEMRTRLIRLDGSLSRLDHIHLASLYQPRNGLSGGRTTG